ncbi:MAG: TraB/GumN family protein, partial [Bacteroidota bacterium]|nr:TraB/GumN family protein [Bacteroidota bacterium]
MKSLLGALLFLVLSPVSFAQSPKKIAAEKYPSLLWEITGNGLRKPSYLFGTMHVSNKMVFNLSDSFYLGIKNAQIVALETNPGTWQEDFSKYDLEGEGMRSNLGHYSGKGYGSTPQDYLSIRTLQLQPFEKGMEAALYSNPSTINSFLYRSNAEGAADFEEDTYLDLHIYQAGRKLGKKLCGVEDFHGSMKLVKEAYQDAAKEKKKNRGFDYDEDFSYARMEEAYRTGNLDLLDTINKVNSQSAAFDEKFLYKRNDIQAASIDSILKTGSTLFAGVGAAHLPGERGVIEILRRQGYKLRPIKMKERDSNHKESIERTRVPVQFFQQAAEDGTYRVMVPGRLYSFGRSSEGFEMKQYADMTNGSYYIVTRLTTNAAILGLSEIEVQRKLDSVLYENIPGKILQKKSILRNGYRGYDITNRTRRGDIQRYNIFITPFELLIFKMSGTGNYVRLGSEAEQFFSSIQLKEQKPEWKRWSPSYGGFE